MDNQKPLILLIDDDESFTQVLSRALQRRDFQTLIANDTASAIELGATNYLCKPANTEEILAAFNKPTGNANVEIPEERPSVDRLEWEHIQKVLSENDGNISATARALGMHRRTLQRKLNKRPVKK
jgi:ActR/RegA family two-component response regulator